MILEMSSISQIQRPIALGEEKPHECGFLGCTDRFSRRSDANRHYDHKHNAELHAHCPVCEKMISDARKDKQREHMTKLHPYAVPVNQAWIKVSVPEQALRPLPATPASYPTSMLSTSDGATGTVLQPLAIYSTFYGQEYPAALEASHPSNVFNGIELQHLPDYFPHPMLEISNPQSTISMQSVINNHASPTPESAHGFDIPRFTSTTTSPFRSESGHAAMWNAPGTEDTAQLPNEFNQVFALLAENHNGSTDDNGLQI